MIFNSLDVFFRKNMKRFQGEGSGQDIGTGRAQEVHEVPLQGEKSLCERSFSCQLEHRYPVQQKRAEKPVHGREILLRSVGSGGKCCDLCHVLTEDSDGFLQERLYTLHMILFCGMISVKR